MNIKSMAEGKYNRYVQDYSSSTENASNQNGYPDLRFLTLSSVSQIVNPARKWTPMNMVWVAVPCNAMI